MLPLYKAISVDQQAIISGSTKPCLMTVADDRGEIVGDYVVKVFKPNNILQGQSTNKEVYGSLLAQAFDFAVPKPALVKVSSQIIDKLNQSPHYRNFSLMPGVYFGSEYLDDPLDYKEDVDMKLQDWEEETIFAFDAFILNIDRRTKKPNLFFKDGMVHLIDHELSLNLSGKTFDELYQEREKNWKFMVLDTPEIERKHLFYDKLKARNQKNLINFDTFREYLRILDVDTIDEYAAQLNNTGNDSDDWIGIKYYLEAVKAKPDQFIQILQELIA